MTATSTGKKRLDQQLVEQGLVESRAKAQALISAGLVEVDGEVLRKASIKVAAEAQIKVLGLDHPWVSRGGMKLAGALDLFPQDLSGAVCLDLGASTGGFTDVLLQAGAGKVYAVDVGHDQLASKLRSDQRVISLEGVNGRYLDQALVPDPVDLLVCDASFISLKKLLPQPLSLVRCGGAALVLVKPQFEVGKGRLGKGGIVKDPALHEEVCQTLSDWWNDLPGWSVSGLADSPILGPDGNKEFLLAAIRNGPDVAS
ncbi:TlyA family RNA methyltransferase [Rhodovibrionaceae bacterium A322]